MKELRQFAEGRLLSADGYALFALAVALAIVSLG